jgi:amino acid adenylation domain-containing protein
MKRIPASSPLKSEFDLVHEMVQQQAERRLDAVAVVDEQGGCLSYGELVRRADLLARRLWASGVRPQHRVAVWMERSIDLFVALLGVMQSGGAYVPVDRRYPQDRVRTMLRHAQPSVLITDVPQPEAAAGPGVCVMRPDVLSEAGEPGSRVRRSIALDHPAYVIYTSGSTGEPKGVVMTHRGLSRLIRWQIRDGQSGLSTLQFTPVCFDVALQEVFATLCAGGQLVVAGDDTRRDPVRLLQLLERREVHRLFLPYVALQQLAKTALATGQLPRRLRHVITAGEQLVVTDAVRRFFMALPECRLDNHYGPTEAHLVTRWTLGPEAARWPALPPIGTAVAGVTLYCLDGQLQPVPAGQPGELYVGGAGLALGYLGAPRQTADRFLPDPFTTTAGARMYRTGDVVRVGEGGALEFLGRNDDQIKVRGFRVEPAEVQRALLDVEGVQEAAVGLRTVSDGVQVLAGYVVAEPGRTDAARLGQALRGRLPEYMVPSCFVFLDRLPLSATGKVDLRQLAQLPLPAAEPAAAASLHEVVRSIWERVLGHDELTADDDFFEVGGDSLLATWVVSELGRVLRREIDLSLLLKSSTIAGMAAALEAMDLRPVAQRSASEVITLRPGPSQRALFLVHPLGGELLAYRELARAVRAPLRVLGLRWQPEGLGGAAGASLCELAQAHVAQLRLVQPSGPYLLAGWSFGGVLAMEIAQQLIAAGEQVDFLGLLDANPRIDPTTGLPTAQSPLPGHLTQALQAMDRTSEAGGTAPLPTDPELLALLGNTVPEGVTSEHLRRNLAITRDSLHAAMQYRPQPYLGAIDLFQPQQSPAGRQPLLAASLRELALGPLRLHAVPGDHYTMMRTPHVQAMGSAIDEVLASINAR